LEFTQSDRNDDRKELLKLAKLPPNICPYDLLHAFATHLLESGAILKDVSELLGHSSIRVTADVYVQVSEKRKHSIVALLDNSELAAE
jgi:site-specific recombinase XerD